VVEAVLTGFTDEERRLFPREISIDPGDRSESLLVRLTAAADPDDAEAVTIRRWFPEAGHDRAPSREQVAAFGWRFLPATRGTAAAAVDGERSALHTLLKAIDLGAETADLAGLLEGFNAKLAVSERITDLRAVEGGLPPVHGHAARHRPGGHLAAHGGRPPGGRTRRRVDVLRARRPATARLQAHRQERLLRPDTRRGR
jgi:putative ATP-dependent endonuclease of OLD family